MRSPKNELTAKKKSLTIHIDTEHIGPHGMPLVYGSTPEKVGTIKGSVRFSSNYDCKGRDIQVIYEAWIESHWTDAHHKREHHHRMKEVFGYQTLSFPLIHTKHNGSTVVAGEYVKEFTIPLVCLAGQARESFDSITSERPSPSSTAAGGIVPTSSSSSPSPASLSSVESTVSVPPSSNYGPHTKTRYTVRAVLQRPFPSLSNVEASQEIWVVNSPAPDSILTPPQIAVWTCEETEASLLRAEESTSVWSERSLCDPNAREPARSGPSSSIAMSVTHPHSLAAMPSTPYGNKQ
ncbi:hypothetical protein BGZ54_001049, partial [Gamsiella multidivaricata]